MEHEEAVVIQENCGIYNILFKKPLLNSKGKHCGNLYIHVPNCTLNDKDAYKAHFSDENRSSIAYRQFCDLAKVPYNTSCYGLFKVLRSNQLKW